MPSFKMPSFKTPSFKMPSFKTPSFKMLGLKCLVLKIPTLKMLIMTRRSAPFVAPDFFSLSDLNDLSASTRLEGVDNVNNLDTKARKQYAKELLSTLQADIAAFRDEQFPPDILRQVRDMPIYQGNMAEVKAYQQRWQPYLDRAMLFYPSAYLPPDNLPLPASLEIPQFVYHVQRLHLTKTRAKESKNFGSVGALVAKCGEFKDKEIALLEKVLAQDEGVRLVAHREFIDLRAYVFCRNQKGELLEPERLRFYRTGLIVQALPDFKIVDSRQKPRKRRNDAYSLPLADNDVWRIYQKK